MISLLNMTEIKELKFGIPDVLKLITIIITVTMLYTSIKSSVDRSNDDIKELKGLLEKSINKSELDMRTMDAKLNEMNLRITIIEKKLEQNGANHTKGYIQ